MFGLMLKRCEYRGKFLELSDTRNEPYPDPSYRRGVYTKFSKMTTKTLSLISLFELCMRLFD